MDTPQAHHTIGHDRPVDESPAAPGGRRYGMSPDHRLDGDPPVWSGQGMPTPPTHRSAIVTSTTQPDAKRPTAKQLTYLRTLANRTGTTFATPISREDASAEIRRLKRIADTGFTFAELKAEEAVRRDHDDERLPAELATAVQEWETVGWGSTATWSQRA